MSSKLIYMDGIATARRQKDGRVRIDLGSSTSHAFEASLAGVVLAVRRIEHQEADAAMRESAEVLGSLVNGPATGSGVGARVDRAS